METVSALLALCAGNSPVTGEFPSQRPVTRSLDVFFDLRLNTLFSLRLLYIVVSGSVNNREAGDFRCHRAHYDVTVMIDMLKKEYDVDVKLYSSLYGAALTPSIL